MPIKRIQQTVPLRILDWQRCVGLFLEGFSLLCELHGAQVPEGRVEPLVVVPPHVPVDVRAWLLHVRVDVPVDELLPDEPVGGFDHRVVVWVAGSGKGTCDAEHVEHAFDAFPGEPAAAVRVVCFCKLASTVWALFFSSIGGWFPTETASSGPPPFSWLSGHEGVLAAVGASLESDEPAVVHGAVDQRGGHVLVAEHASPAGELDVRGVDDAPGLVGI